MKNINYYNYNYDYNHDYDYSNYYQNSLMNKMTLNKNNKNLGLSNYNRVNSYNSNDYIYYEKNIELPTNKRNKLSEEKKNINPINYYKKELYKKTINTYSNKNRYQDRNILEELQNNKYLRPMLITNNINRKLLKFKVEPPIKNICSLCSKNYFSNVEFPFQKCQSPQKFIKKIYDDEVNINYYNINNWTEVDKYKINTNYLNSPSKYTLSVPNNNSNSYMYRDESHNFNNNNLLGYYSVNNIKKFNSKLVGRIKNVKKEKKKFLAISRNPKIYHRNIISVRTPFNTSNNITNYSNNIKNNIKIELKSNHKTNLKNDKLLSDKNLLQIYKSKLVEEFIIVLNKLILKYIKKIGKLFLKKLINFNNKFKIYFKKKKNINLLNIKKITLKDRDNDIKLTVENSISKISFDNKSYSNEAKSSSLTSNLRKNKNNHMLSKHNLSFILSDLKHKSPEDSINKYKKDYLFQKKIIVKKRSFGSHNKNIAKSPSQFETRDSGGEIFIYKKKNLKNDNLCINKNVKYKGIIDLKLNSTKYSRYNKIINKNKNGKIIDIDINLGKPISIINGLSPLKELIIEKDSPKVFKLNTLPNKYIDREKNRKKKSNSKSGSKNKIKPPLSTKKFLEEEDYFDDDKLNNNNYLNNNNRSYSSIKEYKNNINKSIQENNNRIKYNFNQEISRISIEDKKEKNSKIFIRFNNFAFINNSQKTINYAKFINLIKENNISILLKNNKNNKNKKIKKIKNNSLVKRNIKKNKGNTLYINCTKFLEKVFNKIIKKKVFITLIKYSKK